MFEKHREGSSPRREGRGEGGGGGRSPGPTFPRAGPMSLSVGLPGNASERAGRRGDRSARPGERPFDVLIRSAATSGGIHFSTERIHFNFTF